MNRQNQHMARLLEMRKRHQMGQRRLHHTDQVWWSIAECTRPCLDVEDLTPDEAFKTPEEIREMFGIEEK